MRIWGFILGFGVGAFQTACAQLPSSALPSNAWSQLTTPARGNSESIGFYSHGCLRGAHELPKDGVGYQSMVLDRNRHFGHPDLIAWIQSFSKRVDAVGSGLLIGDLAQVRGGPLPYGHASHQLGLDVDIWFWTHPEQRIRSLSIEERNTLPMISMLNENGLVDPKRFGTEQILKLKLATLDPKVERIFVNPAIKTYLCLSLPSSELGWLHQLRPWPGHDSHFHVRLRCPDSSSACVHQDVVPPGDGCSEILKPNGNTPIDLGIKNPLGGGEPPHPLQSAPSTPLPAECEKILKE